MFSVCAQQKDRECLPLPTEILLKLRDGRQDHPVARRTRRGPSPFFLQTNAPAVSAPQDLVAAVRGTLPKISEVRMGTLGTFRTTGEGRKIRKTTFGRF